MTPPGVSPLRDPTVQISRSGFLKPDSPGASRLDLEDAVKDAALIGAAQKVEHYEIAAYGTVCAFAKQLGQTQQESLLTETLEEEKETDEKLTKMAQEINPQANEAAGEEQERVGKKNKSKRAA
jgi:hypothetical protein